MQEMNTYIQYIRRNRTAHLRDRDIYLRYLGNELQGIVSFKKRTPDSDYYKDLLHSVQNIEQDTRKALLHAQAAFNGLNKCKGNGAPESNESVVIDFLENMSLVCICALKSIKILTGLNKKHRAGARGKSGPIQNYFKYAFEEAQANSDFFLKVAEKRLQMLDMLLAYLE
jgi:hypothetical protein